MSDEEDADVMIPNTRKRTRQTTILEDDEEWENFGTTILNTRSKASRTGPGTGASKPITIDSDDNDEETEMEQVARPASATGRKLVVEESDDEEMEESGPASRTRGASTRHQEVSDEEEDEDESEQEEDSKLDANTRKPTPNTVTSTESGSSRRSSRIQQIQEQRGSRVSSARKLNFLSLDNCLDGLQNKNVVAGVEAAFDSDSSDDESPSAVQEEPRPARPKTKRAKKKKDPVKIDEKAYADGGEDLDEFICNDDQVEYMNEDEQAVLGGPSDDEQHQYDDPDDDGQITRMLMQTREQSEWFYLYLEYLEACILDESLVSRMQRSKLSPKEQLYREAMHHVERAICSRRDSIRTSVVWSSDLIASLDCSSQYSTSITDPETECEACNRQHHVATAIVHLRGIDFDARQLYKDNWLMKLRRAMTSPQRTFEEFRMGSVCHARTLAYWQLLHAKHFWCVLVEEKMRKHGGKDGRIADSQRRKFHRCEYDRYKRLMSIVDRFNRHAGSSYGHMPNVWSNVSPRKVRSSLLPATMQKVRDNSGRRGTLSSIMTAVNDDSTESEVGEEEVAAMEEDEQRETTDSTDKLPTMQLTSTITTPYEEESKPDKCMLCMKNTRDGLIVHGSSVHCYSCYACATAEVRMSRSCLACDQPIDQVLQMQATNEDVIHTRLETRSI